MRYSPSREYRVSHLPQFLSPYQQLDQLGYPDCGLPMKLLGRLQRTRSREYRVPHPVLTNLLTSGEDVYLLIHQFLYPLSLGLYLTVAYGLLDCGLPMKLLGRLQRTRSREYRVLHLRVSRLLYLSQFPDQHPLEMQS